MDDMSLKGIETFVEVVEQWLEAAFVGVEDSPTSQLPGA